KATIPLSNDAAQSCPAIFSSLDSIAISATSTGTTRASRKDKHLHSFPPRWLFTITEIARQVSGAIHVPSLPPFTMSRSSSNPIPATPRVISPSPTPSETREASQDGYFGPMTRSARKRVAAAAISIDEDIDEDIEDGEVKESESYESTKNLWAYLRQPSSYSRDEKPSPLANTNANGNVPVKNDHLSPTSASPGWSWRDLSRSPSPLGLIPIHRHWRSFVHRHEVPRKVLHVSIGFFTIWLYVSGVQTNAITPWLMSALVPIAATDYLRHQYPPLNRFYVRVLGALMRETEYAGWNGVIWYLLGAWIVLGFFPKDVGVMGILLLSWCDTAASTIGRAYGRYTPRIRRGKSLAGSLAAFAVGVITAASFWGWLGPRTGPFTDDIDWPFMFTGTLALPAIVREAFGLSRAQASISSGLALGVMSLWTGFVASASEVVDIFGWDDNLTIPVLSGIGMWGFLKVFG
ncbi:cytidylyltransferase, partial [Diplocarpon rosae]